MITIDGSKFESGGAMLRQALGLSILTQKPFAMESIRSGRPVPGLKAQHLAALNAAHQLCQARLEGNHLGSTKVTFFPGQIAKTKLSIDIGTAGSATLLLQTFLVPMVFSDRQFSVEVKGGTDVAWSIPVDYFSKVLLPQLRKFCECDLKIVRRGYFPRGGGQVVFTCKGRYPLGTGAPRISLISQGEVFKVWGLCHASESLMESRVAERVGQSARVALSDLKVPVDIQSSYAATNSPGCGVVLWALCGDSEGVNQLNPVILGESELGKRAVSSEDLGLSAARKLKEVLESGAACDPFLADQLIAFLGVVGGSIKCGDVSLHTKSNIYVTEKFLGEIFTSEDGVISASPSGDWRRAP